MLKSKKELEFAIGYKYSKLESIANNLDQYYYNYSVLKYDNNGKPKIKNGEVQKRNFHPSKHDLKDVQERINSNVLPNINLLSCIKGGVKGVGNVDNASAHKGKKYHFQTDLSSFFPSVKRKMIFNSFMKKGFSKKNADLLSKLVSYNDFLPQGAPTSTMVANLVFEKVDKKILKLIEGKNITYTRWVDDLTFSSSTCFKDILPDIIKTIASNGFKPSKEKTLYKVGNSVVTGVLVKNNYMTVTDKFRAKELIGNEDQIKGKKAYKNQIEKVNKRKIK